MKLSLPFVTVLFTLVILTQSARVKRQRRSSSEWVPVGRTRYDFRSFQATATGSGVPTPQGVQGRRRKCEWDDFHNAEFCQYIPPSSPPRPYSPPPPFIRPPTNSPWYRNPFIYYTPPPPPPPDDNEEVVIWRPPGRPRPTQPPPPPPPDDYEEVVIWRPPGRPRPTQPPPPVPRPPPPPPPPVPRPPPPPPPGPNYLSCIQVGGLKCCTFEPVGKIICNELSGTGMLPYDGRCCQRFDTNEYCCGDRCLQELQQCVVPWVDTRPYSHCLLRVNSFYYCCTMDDLITLSGCDDAGGFMSNDKCCPTANRAIWCCSDEYGCTDRCVSVHARRLFIFGAEGPLGRGFRPRQRSLHWPPAFQRL